MTGSLTKTVSRRVSGSSTYVSTCHATAADIRGVLVCSLGCVEVSRCLFILLFQWELFLDLFELL